ncbi:aldose epimerase family protein [Flammeovirga sp. EKP202]|uniref:aldose epimerase family protein n=1 Tax=Flammeovirga sp. EKP202 TaxID=2770592 RepID=UPI00165F6790|nr:aldose epimerase family protein [Flammeovirga sp. EKP202]MBD0400733.1 galactose mutarotase [Flammeovirga sp. EKP202]
MIDIKQIEKVSWGKVNDKEVFLYTLTNQLGSQLKVSTYGGILVSFLTADKNGEMADVLLGKDSLEDYLDNSCYLGATVGQFANRIAKGNISIDGVEYQLATNNGPNFLHGGDVGFDRQVFDIVEEISEGSVNSVVLSHTSPDGFENLPGNVTLTLKISLTDENEVILDYSATTDKKTIVNFTSHPYFNLKGEGEISDHTLKLNCNFYTPIDETCIPTGEIATVKGTPFDFTEEKVIGNEIDADHDQTKIGIGYDHNLVINKPLNEYGLVGVAYEATTGRAMEVYTTEPGVQFYTGNWLEGELGKNQTPLIKRQGFCLEAQHYPDSPNQPHFPSVILNPGEEYTQKTVYKFVVK